MNISLSKFCKHHNLPKSSVHNRCKELGIPTSEGLTPEAAAQLAYEFGLNLQSSQPPAAAVSATVDMGHHHQLILVKPDLPLSYALESLRNSEAVVLEDPLVIAQQFLQVADTLTVAMAADIQVREQRLQQTQQAKAAIVAKASELQLESRLYQMQTSALDKSVTAETSALQAAMSQLQSLGKSSS